MAIEKLPAAYHTKQTGDPIPAEVWNNTTSKIDEVIEDLNGTDAKVPSEADASNKLADRSWVENKLRFVADPFISTYAEVRAAYNAGRQIVCEDDGVIYTLRDVGDDVFVFTHFDGEQGLVSEWILNSSGWLDDAYSYAGENRVEAIENVIPSGTTASNKLVNQSTMDTEMGQNFQEFQQTITDPLDDRLAAAEGTIPADASPSNKMATAADLVGLAPETWVNTNYVHKEEGKVLSDNNYTNTDKNKVANLPSDTNAELAKKADKDGVIAFAKDIVSREDGIGAEFTRRRSAGQLHIGDGSAFIRSIHGKTLMWNQLVQNGDFSDGTNHWDRAALSSFAVVDGVLAVTIGDTAIAGKVVFPTEPNFIASHKYIAISQIKADAGVTIRRYAGTEVSTLLDGDGNWHTITDLFTPSAVSQYQFRTAATNTTFYIKSCAIFDLTQMGIADQISTPADFEALFPAAYYAFNAGTPITFKGEKIVTNGFNQWDEEWENGYYDIDTGAQKSSVDNIRSKNPIKVIPNADYYCKCPNATSVALFILWYDSEDNYISYATATNLIRTSPANAYYARFYMSRAYGATYNHDICINFSNASLNGTYKPYEEHELSLPVGITKTYTGADGQQHTWVGLDSAGTAYDEQTPTKDIKRIGVVDLGTLDWIEFGQPISGLIRSQVTISDLKSGVANEVSNLVCSKLKTVVSTAAMTGTEDTGIFAYTNNRLFVLLPESAYDNISEFKTAMAGVLLFYELAEPVETEYAEPRNFNYFVSDMGEEWLLPEGVDASGLPKTTPFNGVIAYASNVRDTIFHLPENYISKESFVAFLEALKTAEVIASYTMTFDTATNKYAFTITKSA